MFKVYYKTIDSTQNEAWRRISNNEENGVIVSEIQTNGKGTHGRTWITDESNNIAFSVFIKLDSKIQRLEDITIRIAEIIVNIFESKYGIKLDIKEPNDIVTCGKKIGGILTEIKSQKEIVKYLVVGIGINTNKENFNEELKNIATSIKQEFGITVNSDEFIDEFCIRFEKEIKRRLV